MIATLYSWYGKTTVHITAALIIALVIGAFFTFGAGDAPAEEATALLPTVPVATAASLSGNSSLTLIGTVTAVSEAEIQASVGGRITSVPITLGASVSAGQVIATLENASEAATVLQAEGSYDAAVAAAAQSDVGVNSAQTSVASAENNVTAARNTVVSLYRDAYTTANSIVLNQIDMFYANPLQQLPSLKIDGRGQAPSLNTERVSLQTLLQNWQEDSNTLSSDNDLELALEETRVRVTRIRSLVDTFITLVAEEEAGEVFSEAELNSARTGLVTARNSLNASLSSTDSARTGLINAEKNLARAKDSLNSAQIGGTNTGVSAASAQVKQALGVLRSAQANFAKTIIRTPISGTVNELPVKTGDFISAFTPIAKVANNNALAVTTFVGENDRDAIAAGDAVLLDNQYEGVITTIAPAVNSETKKIEVKIGTETAALANGDTVRITKANLTDETKVQEALFLPLSAVRFTSDAGTIFTVVDNQIVSIPVELGTIRGSFVEILDGITANQEIVVDARGFAPGQEVEAVSNN